MGNRLFILLVCSVLVTGCGRQSAEEMLAKARATHMAGNPAQAIEEFSAVIKEHPGTPEAETAAFQIATIYNNDTRQYGKAIDAYKQYIASHPAGQHTAMATFLVGYLYHNELHNLDSAAAVFKEFLEKYPEDEMAPSARFELENLGKSPEELIPAPAAASDIATPSSPKGAKKN